MDMVHGDVAGDDFLLTQPLVLIVEDDQSTRMRQGVFDGLGIPHHRSPQRVSGRLKRRRTHHPDAVLTDLAVPGMDGFEFAARFARRPARRTPIVAITGYPDYLTNPERICQPASRVMTKPCNLENIVRELRRLLNGQATT